MSDSFFGFDASLPGEDDDGGGGGRKKRTGGGGRVLGGGGSGGRGSDSEEEYDALNDETFGQAREDDWEDLHENLVRLDQREGGDGDSGPDSDLDINFSSVGIDNFELDNDNEPEARLQLDPSVWTMPSKPETPRHHPIPPVVPTPMQPPPVVPQPQTPLPTDRFGGPPLGGRFPALPNTGLRICSLEEIEQNMIKQQQEQMRRGMTPLPRPPPGFPQPSGAGQPPPPMQPGQPGPPSGPLIHRPLPMPIGFPGSPGLMGAPGAPGGVGGGGGGPPPLFPPTNMPPPNAGGPFPFPLNFPGGPGQQPNANNNNNLNSMSNNGGNNNNNNNSSSNNNNNNNNNASFSQRLVEEIQQNHPMLPHYRQQPPPGGPPLPMGVPPPGQPPGGGGGPMPPMPPLGANFKHPFMPHLPTFGPNWNGPPPPHHPHHGGPHHHPGFPGHHFPPPQPQQPGQGHHPPPHHQYGGLHQQQLQQQQPHHHAHHHQHHPHAHPHHNHHHQQQQQQQQHQHHHHHNNRLPNGKQNRNYEYDEYANMMSDRAKNWLLGIQLSQLNKDTAYYNDYYFCVIRDRKDRERGAERESKAHKDNTFYHPFSQQQQQQHQQQQQQHWNGIGGRERRNSENSTKDGIKEVPRRYKLVQFENSLGKLQCGSVIAPRKIIDQDVVVEGGGGGGAGGGVASAGAAGSGGGAATAASATGAGAGTTTASVVPGSSDSVHNQRRSRQILLHVENLYRLVLRLEDMSNQLAIEAKQQMKEKRAKERLLAQEKLQASGGGGGGTDEQNNVSGGGTAQLAPPPATPVSEVEQDTVENLLERILPGVNGEGVLRLLSVRKGKLLLTRIQKSLAEHTARWTVWCTVLGTLVTLPKRDREDAEDQLSPLFAELELHVKYAQPADLLPLFETLLNTDQLLPLVPRCKFLLLTMLTLIAQMEQLAEGDEALKQAARAATQNGEEKGEPSATAAAAAAATSPRLIWSRWMTLLRELARVLDGPVAPSSKPHKILLKLDASCGKVKQLRAHLQRHPELELERKLQAIVSLIDAGAGGPSSLTAAVDDEGKK
uniref:mRNA decay factor PAT1 domain-containing protein n=1 Tax=Anopheles farauti TaxID=69004 RepID=A0A182Q5B9_9DIPT